MRLGFAILILCFGLFPLLGQPAIVADGGMVVSSSPLASEVGAEVLRSGGNAVDAAVAVGFALAVTWPQAGNLGGGGFMLIHKADGQVFALDFREVAPRRSHRDMFLDQEGQPVPGLSTASHLAAGVPGTVRGLLEALKAHGTRTRQELLQPAISLAEGGFPLSQSLADQFVTYLDAFRKYPASLTVFSNQGKPYAKGDLWRQPDLAKTLRTISKRGANGFYRGWVAAAIAAEMRRSGGLIDKKDLRRYRPRWREPVRADYRDHSVYSMPPPSAGGLMLAHMLRMIEPHGLKEMGWGSESLTHLMAEVERRAFADRAHHFGDPDFWQVPSAWFTSATYARERMASFDPNRATPSETLGHGMPAEESPQTTHFSIADRDGNAVACTVTLNASYGNKIVVPGTGFLLNNEMDDFSVKPGVPNLYGLLGSEANAIRPGKRMLSSMTPTIVARDGKPRLVLGSPGGSKIITTVFQVMLNVIDHGMAADAAVLAPRFHHQWKPDRITYEPHALSPDTLAGLRAKGHEIIKEKSPIGLGEAHVILIEKDRFYGAADPRRERTRAVGVTGSQRGTKAERRP